MPVKDVTTKEKHREMKHHGLPENGEWGPLEKEHGWLLKGESKGMSFPRASREECGPSNSLTLVQ